MVEIDRGRRKVWGLGGEPSGWGRGRWDGALSFHLLEISPSFRPHPPQLAGKSSQPYPPSTSRLLTDVLGKGGGLREGRVERGCREGKLKEGEGDPWKG